MRMPAHQPQCTSGGSCPEPNPNQPSLEHKQLQTKRVGASELAQGTVPPLVREVLRSPGQPLDIATRAFMEPRFGHDFSHVRVHTDARAADSARSLDAQAYTVGSNAVFDMGRYAPGTADGRRLLANELTHVLQQSSRGNNAGNVVMCQRQTETKFAGCNATQVSQIGTAIRDANAAINAATAIVGSAYGRPNQLSAAHRQLLLDHFHTTSHDDLRTILGNYTSIKRAFETGLELRCEATCKKDTAQGTCVAGYAAATKVFGGFGPLHLCFDTSPGGCDFATSTAADNAALLIHEAAHRHAGIKGDVYRWDPSYASLSSEAALKNADSYAWFAVLA
jgi:hypothetical protein